jgi:hypothetical protein
VPTPKIIALSRYNITVHVKQYSLIRLLLYQWYENDIGVLSTDEFELHTECAHISISDPKDSA